MTSQSERGSAQSLSGKEPWLAVNLSLFFPGIGHIYANSMARGFLLISLQLVFYGMSAWLIVSSPGNIAIGLLLLLATCCLSSWTIFDSYQCAKKLNSSRFEKRRKRQKDPWLAVLLSRFVPGLGHLYLHKLWLSILLFTCFIPSLMVQLAPILLKALIAYHAYITAPIRREKNQTYILIISVLSVITSILITLQGFFIKTYIADIQYISANSMMPILQKGDRVLVDKWTYRLHTIQRGDIIVFSPPETLQEQNFQEAFVKRVIGLPGEEIEIKQGTVYINHQPLTEDYITDRPRFQSPPITVLPNSYLVLGDNRNHSYDSLDWGLLPRRNIMGKVSKRFWPLQRLGAIPIRL